MATTIEQIRKVNIYEEDKDHNRTLVQTDVPLGSNVVMEGKAPEAEELYLLTGKKDTTANTITLYPTQVKVTSNGSIDATDFTMSGSSVNSNYMSTITWGEEKETLEDGTEKVSARRLYYKINNYKIQVKTEDGQNSLNLLQVPYLELYEPNTIKTTKNMAKPLLLNVENVVNNNLANDTKVVLGHTAIKNSTLDMVDNTNGYLGARLGIDTRETKRYGYLNFYRTEIKEDNTVDRYETGSIFTDTGENFCIIPRNIHFSKIDEPDRDSQGEIIEKLPVISGYLGTERHQFKSVWAETLHGILQGKIDIPTYTSEDDVDGRKDVWLEKLGDLHQIFYIGKKFVNGVNDMPNKNITDGFCITLSVPKAHCKKQIFIGSNGISNSISNNQIYIRGFSDTIYGPWSSALGATDWVLKTDSGINIAKAQTGGDKIKYYFVLKGNPEPIFIFKRNYIDIYQSLSSIQPEYTYLQHISQASAKSAIESARADYTGANACGLINIPYYFSTSGPATVTLFFNYNKNKEVCLYGFAVVKNNVIQENIKISLKFKQYD